MNYKQSPASGGHGDYIPSGHYRTLIRSCLIAQYGYPCERAAFDKRVKSTLDAVAMMELNGTPSTKPVKDADEARCLWHFAAPGLEREGIERLGRILIDRDGGDGQ